MESMKALIAWMAEITHIVATGPFGMTADQRQRLDGLIKTVQSEVKQAEEAHKRWMEDAVEIQGETVDATSPAQAPVSETTAAGEAIVGKPSADSGFPVLPLGSQLKLTSGVPEPTPAPAGEKPAAEPAPKATTKTSAKA